MRYKDPELSLEEVRERFLYDCDTGVVTYRNAPEGRPGLAGSVVGYIRTSPTGHKYRVVKIGGKAVYLHRLIWFYVFARWPEGLLDHKDEDTLNNRLLNLRPATQSKNKSNCKKYRSNTSGFKGVTKYISKQGLRWKAQITHQQKVIYLGLYDSKEEAHNAYLNAAKELQGLFANSG